MSEVIKNVGEVKPEKVEEFNDMNYSTQYQTNLKDPEDVTLDLGNIQYNYNTELTLLTVSAAPMEKKKDGTLSAARSKAVSSQRMRDLCAFAARKSEDLAARIVQGEIQALPCRRKNFIVCDWCSLKEACPWDRHIPGCTSRQIREFPNEDAIWEIIGQQTSKE